MKRGRPVRSEIRQRLIEILSVMGQTYGYQLHKAYVDIFGKITREVVYYHLRKGITLGEFVIAEIKQEKGAYSWGGIVEKKYYKVGPKASPKGDPQIRAYFEKKKAV